LKDKEGENEEKADPDRPIFSLVTGKYRHAKKYGEGLNSFSFLMIIFSLLSQTVETPVDNAIEGGDTSVILRNEQRSLMVSDRAAGE